MYLFYYLFLCFIQVAWICARTLADFYQSCPQFPWPVQGNLELSIYMNDLRNARKTNIKMAEIRFGIQSSPFRVPRVVTPLLLITTISVI